MEFWQRVLGYRDFAKKMQIEHSIANEYGGKSDAFDHFEGFFFFHTSRQKTWLFASGKGLYCVLDDITNDSFEIKWEILKRELVSNGKVTLDIEFGPDYSAQSGRIHFGKHKNWLYTKKLFNDTGALRYSIQSLILAKMG